MANRKILLASCNDELAWDNRSHGAPVAARKDETDLDQPGNVLAKSGGTGQPHLAGTFAASGAMSGYNGIIESPLPGKNFQIRGGAEASRAGGSFDILCYDFVADFSFDTGNSEGTWGVKNFYTNDLCDGGGVANGTIAVIWECTQAGGGGARTFRPALWIKLSGAWAIIAGAVGTSRTVASPTAFNHYTLMVDETSGSERVRLIRDGVEEIGWQSDTTIASVATTTPGFQITFDNPSSLKSIQGRLIHNEWFVYEQDDITIDTYGGAGGDVRCWSLKPVADVAGGDWSQSGNSAACGTAVWPGQDDTYDDANQDPDYATRVKHATIDQDQLFTFDQIGVTSPVTTIEAVYLSCIVPATVDAGEVSKFIANIDGGTIAEYTPTAGYVGSSGDGTTLYAFLQLDPDGNAGTLANLNLFQAGVRLDAGSSEDGKCYGFQVGIVGQGPDTDAARQPAAAAACPSGVTFVPKVMIY